MADDISSNNMTATDVATFLTDNPDSIAHILATHPKLLAVCLAAANDHAQNKQPLDPKVLDLSPALNFKAHQDARRIKKTHESLLHVAAQKLLVKPAQSLAIIRLPDQLPDPVSKAVLILGGKTMNSFHPNLGGDLLVLLAEIVGVTLAARLELQDPVQ